ncbi:MAG: pimeloyl-ACP methyl ester carboxylesterase [Crocinitomix sp.]|jgi:pimeloyl-ACP methyl ester carboxylesterase
MNVKSIFALLFLTFFGMQASFALNPSRTYKQLPDKFNMKYTAHDVKTEDGAKLKAWYFPANVKTTNLILISHNGEGNMADYLRRVDQFTSIGYNVVTYDYRRYGESSEFEIDNNMYLYPHFLKDIKAMIDFCRMQHVQTFHMYGWGVGAGLSLGVGYNRTEILSIIADTPFLSMEDLEGRFSNWDDPMEVPFASYDKKFEPINALDSAPTTLNGKGKRIKLIVGSNDRLYNKDDYTELLGKQKKIVAKEIHVVKNPDRKDNFQVDKTAYMNVVKAFLRVE